ncbi:MAG: flagellar biosynthetic protein FliO [Rhodospirillales bacterium]|nr:flagellar biosynthetic protein FliO [Rhodospirillales bacterium]MCB9965285.1 flagellar biosynthetic protein FliO [Rhodospirillales bacterium]MCB9972946.1 flagellar biosynthetic protein FliO [Rhodospirillales bacterium]MCB9980116.1 flagellar biosynthetic protein FliO [Rhodospirillales bacterium]
MNTEHILNTFLALIFVLALMGLLALLAKKLNLGQIGGQSRTKRLKIVEVLMLDAKHRAVILQRDDKQHLVILSHNGDTVIETFKPDHETLSEDNVKPIL